MWAWLSFPIGVELPDDRTGFHMIRRAYPRRPLGGALAARQRLKLWDDRTGKPRYAARLRVASTQQAPARMGPVFGVIMIMYKVNTPSHGAEHVAARRIRLSG